MYINKKSPIPAYYQLKSIILKKIDSGEYGAGSPIPSERDLSETLSISRMTVRQALNQLVVEGILYREKGRGTFVSRSKLEQKNIMSFSETVRTKGLVPVTRILNFNREESKQDISEILGIKYSEPVYNIKRLRLANDIPIGIEEVFIPEMYCPDLERYDLTASLYKLLRDEYLHVISYIDNVIESARPFREERELLGIPGSVPVLRISGISYTDSGLKLFYERDVYRSDEYKYNLRIHVTTDLE